MGVNGTGSGVNECTLSPLPAAPVRPASVLPCSTPLPSQCGRTGRHRTPGRGGGRWKGGGSTCAACQRVLAAAERAICGAVATSETSEKSEKVCKGLSWRPGGSGGAVGGVAASAWVLGRRPMPVAEGGAHLGLTRAKVPRPVEPPAKPFAQQEAGPHRGGPRTPEGRWHRGCSITAAPAPGVRTLAPAGNFLGAYGHGATG